MRIEPSTEELELKVCDHPSEWRFWELKNPNMHRGIIDYIPPNNLTVSTIEYTIREMAFDIYEPSWSRGFAFGVLLQFNTSPSWDLRDFEECIDSFNKDTGVLQWIVAVDHQDKKAYGVHMWLHGSLHSAFIKTLDSLSSLGYSTQKTYKEKPSFFKNVERFVGFSFGAMIKLRQVQVVLAAVFFLFLLVQYVQRAF